MKSNKPNQSALNKNKANSGFNINAYFNDDAFSDATDKTNEKSNDSSNNNFNNENNSGNSQPTPINNPNIPICNPQTSKNDLTTIYWFNQDQDSHHKLKNKQNKSFNKQIPQKGTSKQKEKGKERRKEKKKKSDTPHDISPCVKMNYFKFHTVTFSSNQNTAKFDNNTQQTSAPNKIQFICNNGLVNDNDNKKRKKRKDNERDKNTDDSTNVYVNCNSTITSKDQTINHHNKLPQNNCECPIKKFKNFTKYIFCENANKTTCNNDNNNVTQLSNHNKS